MRIAVFGISGRTGLALTENARERGHEILALVRPTAEIPVASHVQVWRGEFSDLAAVQEVITGTRAVICVIGPRPPFRDAFCAPATRAIIESMKASHVTRLVCLTGAMIGALPRNVSHPMRWVARRFASAHPVVAADRAEQEALVRDSSLEWTVVKPPRLTDQPTLRPPVAGVDLRVGLLSSVGRRALAAFLLDEGERPRFFGQAVYLRG